MTTLLSAPAAVCAQACTLLGVPSDGKADEQTLGVLYKAWCQRVPFDSIRKRIATLTADGGVPGGTALSFLNDFLSGGTGGTCWSTSFGLTALARFLGFDARLAAAVMHTDPDVPANHCSVVVTLGRTQFLLDTSMLYETPVDLGRLPESRDDPVHPLRAESTPAGPVIWWKAGHHRAGFIGCTIDLGPFSDEQAVACHERTRHYSLFNDQLFIRRNLGQRIDSFGRGTLISVDKDGETHTAIPVAERDELLVNHFGIAPAVVRLIPPDGPGTGWV
jgi:N-hydroxyarylamine O-acetyltransferase